MLDFGDIGLLYDAGKFVSQLFSNHK